MKEITLEMVKEFGRKIVAGQKAGRDLANLCVEQFKGTRAEIIESLATICRTDTAWKRNKDGQSLGFNHKDLDGIPSVMAFRSARVLLYSDLHEDGHRLTKEEKEEAKKATSDKAKATKEAEKAAIVAQTLEKVKTLTPAFALQFLKEQIASGTFGTKEQAKAIKAIETLETLFNLSE